MALYTYASVRPCTSRMLDMIEEGTMDARTVAEMCLSWLSEDSVKEMMQANDISTGSDDDEDDEYDFLDDDSYDEFDEPDVDESQEFYDFDPDC